jgi:hypothetical protein
MTLHSETEIYAAAADLAGQILRACKELRRDVKPLLGGMLWDEAVWLAVLIRRANIAVDAAKVPILAELLEHLEIMQFALQVANRQRFIPHAAYSRVFEFIGSVARQAQGLKNHFDVSHTAA